MLLQWALNAYPARNVLFIIKRDFKRGCICIRFDLERITHAGSDYESWIEKINL